MIHLTLPDENQRPLPFYLTMEEVAARHFQEECFFTWVVKPTVIFGRNQVMQNEVNLPFCQEHGIQLVRRKSGGGCVYADEGNIMMSYVTPLGGATVEEVFARYLEKAAGALRGLRELGELRELQSLRVEVSGRNDILLAGRKLSGSALYITPDKKHAISHGTLLHSTDIDRMMNAITPSTEKLKKKGVESVRQRVINISEVMDIAIPELREHLARVLCDSEFCFTDAMIAETEALMQDYLAPEWIAGHALTQSDDALFTEEMLQQKEQTK